MKKLIHSIVLLTALFVAAFQPIHASEKYPFAMPANEAIAKITPLEKVSGKTIRLHADEMKLLAEAATGKLEAFSFAEAALIASGAVEPELRKKYLDQLDTIEQKARKALEGAESVAEKGEKLLKFLHSGPMARGYSLEQTDLSVVLEKGRFNCVSSAVLYNVIASRLGLDVHAIEIPGGSYSDGHVFSVLKDGDRVIPVETTNARGFDIHDNMNRDHKREMTELSLIAVIYYNHGVTFDKKHQRHEALQANLCALSLDKTNESAANNAMAALINWERDLSKKGKYNEGLEVLRIGLILAPSDKKLLQNRNVLVQDIVMKEVKAGKYANALSKVDEHKTLLGAEYAHRMAIMVIDTEAQGHCRKKEWEKAVRVYVEALKQRPGDSHLTNNLTVAYDSWARSHTKTSDWAAAIRIYEQGLAILPESGLLQNNLRYVQQQMKR
jgi:tetratricopeptide (TPR) repeat protein